MESWRTAEAGELVVALLDFDSSSPIVSSSRPSRLHRLSTPVVPAPRPAPAARRRPSRSGTRRPFRSWTVKNEMPVNSTGFPVAAKPSRSPSCVPRVVQRAATRSPSAMTSSNVHSRSGSAVTNPPIRSRPFGDPDRVRPVRRPVHVPLRKDLRHDVEVSLVVDLGAHPVDNGDRFLAALRIAAGAIPGAAGVAAGLCGAPAIRAAGPSSARMPNCLSRSS